MKRVKKAIFHTYVLIEKAKYKFEANFVFSMYALCHSKRARRPQLEL